MYGMLKDVLRAVGCTGYWRMYGVLGDVRGVGECAGC